MDTESAFANTGECRLFFRHKDHIGQPGSFLPNGGILLSESPSAISKGVSVEHVKLKLFESYYGLYASGALCEALTGSFMSKFASFVRLGKYFLDATCLSLFCRHWKLKKTTAELHVDEKRSTWHVWWSKAAPDRLGWLDENRLNRTCTQNSGAIHCNSYV